MVERADAEEPADGQAVEGDREAGAGAEHGGQGDEDGAGDDRAEEGEQVQPAAHPRAGVGVLPVPVLEVLRRPDVLGAVALLEDGGDRLVPRSLEFGSVGLHPDHLVVMGKGTHAPRLRTRRLRVIPEAAVTSRARRRRFAAVRNGARPASGWA